jgi:hypothetical protein
MKRHTLNKIKNALRHLGREAKSAAGKEALNVLKGTVSTIATGAGAAYGGPTGAAVANRASAAANRAIERAAKRATRGRGTYGRGRGLYSTGRGLYTGGVSGSVSNGLFAGSSSNNPVFQSKSGVGTSFNENGSVTISKRECIGSINSTGSASWYNQSFAINPGLRAVFPWLSQIAPNFSEYEMFQCIFEYEPVVSAMSVSGVGSLGSIVMSSNYNAGQPKYSTFNQAIESSNAIRGTIANNISLGIECDPEKNANRSKLYIRAGAVPQNQDIKTYDLATAQVGLYGVPSAYIAGTQLGLLWVTYSVVLSKTLFYDGMGLAISADSFCGGGSMTFAQPMGNAPKMSPNNSIGGTLATSGDPVYTFPDDFAGLVQVMIYSRAGITTADGGITLTGNVTLYNYACTNVPVTAFATIFATNRGAVLVYWLDVAATNIDGSNTATWSGYNGTDPVTSTFFSVTMVNPSVATEIPFVPM